MNMNKSEPSKIGQRECGGCGEIITERFLLEALDRYWHEDCLKCTKCQCKLVDLGNSLFTKANLILCKKDYLALYGSTGHCAACNKTIPAFEMVMRARTNVYHLECFACQQCNSRFCIGENFFLCDNKILCATDYKERLVFANMAAHPPSSATLEHIKRQVTHLPQIISPGGSQRPVNGETTHSHNGYPPSATSSTHNILNTMNNLNGIAAQTPYDRADELTTREQHSAASPLCLLR